LDHIWAKLLLRKADIEGMKSDNLLIYIDKNVFNFCEKSLNKNH